MLFSTPVTMQNTESSYEPSINPLCNGPHGGIQRPRKVLDVPFVETGYRYAR